MNKNGIAKLSVDPNWAVTTGTSTINKDPKRVYGLEGDDDDVTKEPKVVEEDLEDSGPDKGQIWTVTEVKTTDVANKFYTFSIDNYFLTGKDQSEITAQGT